MKKLIIGLSLALLLSGCTNPQSSSPKSPSQMTPQERTQELRKTLHQIGIELPENWDQMSKKERGDFLIQKEVLSPETKPIFEL